MVTPVVLFVFKRADLVKQVLDCLSKENIPILYVFSDGPRCELDKLEIDIVRRMIENISWTHVIKDYQVKNLGLGKSIKRGVEIVFREYDQIIVFEDDLVCVQGTYSYLCRALNHYSNDDTVMSVTAWTHPKIIPLSVNSDPYFDGKAECWVWGTWKKSWAGMENSALDIYNECVKNNIDVLKYGSDLPKMAVEAEEKNLWAIGWWYLHMLNNKLCLRPPHSMIETIGWDGRGVTITPDMKEWENPKPLKECPSIPERWPDSVENSECPKLWKIAIDGK